MSPWVGPPTLVDVEEKIGWVSVADVDSTPKYVTVDLNIDFASGSMRVTVLNTVGLEIEEDVAVEFHFSPLPLETWVPLAPVGLGR